MRKMGLKTISEMAKKNDQVIFIGSDLGPGVLEDLKTERPEQFFMEGISEAHVLGMAAGLSMDGHIVYVNTIATFLVKRSLEQLAIDICAENLNVRLYGNGGGLVYGPLGYTHTCLDDFAILQGLPNITVLAPADEFEMQALMQDSLTHQGPIYIRLGKGGDPLVTKTKNIKIGKAQYFGESESGDILLVTTGIMLQRCLDIQKILAEKGLVAHVLHNSTVKPLDDKSLEHYAKSHKKVVVVEEHLKYGGLGSIVSQTLFEKEIFVKFAHFHLGTDYVHEYGRQEELLEFFGVTPEVIAKKLLEGIDG
ncbi:hypothetical protein A9Q84_19380 [Halobacteriovorax marinus]|uniref:Transketolase-like pyrimidine-binding domain-containing protein n=1 Tax=Halobacteriovorax marinus TaxID=97084 RepID=A0A1Y5F2U6_9BACT|nr:hypothetical protein A9Q84_19380 [Halobacteriovorax marinus]